MSASSGTGPLLDPAQAGWLEAASRLYAANPFAPAWQHEMREALGEGYVPEGAAASPVAAFDENAARFWARLAPALDAVAGRLARGAAGTKEELVVYQRAALLGLWLGYGPRLQGLIDANAVDAPFYDAFAEDHRRLLGHPGLTAPEPAHSFAWFYQARRAWYFATTMILGSSPSAAAARVAIWQANLGSDPDLYVSSLWRRMDLFPVLITGETGTGKDCAARCIGWSRYIPFDERTRRFARTYGEDYHVKNIAEVPPELLDSALFGHKKGSYTGATGDAVGFFALAGPGGTLFLDEVGEIPLHLQAKLLRPLENREIGVLGDKRPLKIDGRVLSATNRNLEEECKAGRFRPDLYARLNGYRIEMPPLRRMVAELPDEIRRYTRAFVDSMLDGAPPVDDWAERVAEAIQAAKPTYTWRDNMRELKHFTEQFVLKGGVGVGLPKAEGELGDARGQEARGEEATAGVEARVGVEGEGEGPPSSGGSLWARVKAGEMPLVEMMREVVTRAFVATGESVAETARRLGIDPRTAQKYIDPERLERWRRGRDPSEP